MKLRKKTCGLIGSAKTTIQQSVPTLNCLAVTNVKNFVILIFQHRATVIFTGPYNMESDGIHNGIQILKKPLDKAWSMRLSVICSDGGNATTLIRGSVEAWSSLVHARILRVMYAPSKIFSCIRVLILTQTIFTGKVNETPKSNYF